ncbi:MAG TPA: type IV pilus secretin PilQ [Gammaproteobacteria bacterium]|nr:type IV pilus secretin PilQ [Gammaproteobacteria bacterium]
MSWTRPIGWLAQLVVAAAAMTVGPAFAQGERRLEAIDVLPMPGQGLELRLQLDGAAPDPLAFTIDDPARIALDLPNTVLALPSRRRDVNVGPLTTILAAEANGRSRIVLNMTSLPAYSTRVEGNTVVVSIGSQPGGATPATFAGQPVDSPARALGGPRSINVIDFRRGPDGAGQVLVELNDPRTPVDVRQEGGRIIVEFQDTSLPADLMRRMDVADFATPVATVDALRAGSDTQIIVTASSAYEQVAYQSDNLFTLELKTPVQRETQSAGIFDEEREYTGERLTLNFQDLETRAVLQILADTSGLNIVVSDTVQGSVTLRLQDVPWDQALDILMTTKGLDMRRNGNVIIVAPAEEIAAREQAELEAMAALQELEPLRTEYMQVNYAKASDLAQLIRGEGGGGGGGSAIISPRGSVTVDMRTNTMLVHDTTETLENIRRLVATLDIPVRQVLIESRIVIVNDDYSRSLGSRFGATAVEERGTDGLVSFSGTADASDTIIQSALDNFASTGQPFPVEVAPIDQRYNVNLPATQVAGSLALAILDSDYLIDLELTAIQAEGDGRIVSTPRVIAANNFEASIAQGVQIPYQESSSSGATTTQFQEAVLSLAVTPQITPDDRIIMDLIVTKDSVGEVVPSATGGFVPSIDTRSVETQVLVNDGETVVLGGIYETESRETYTKVPVLGDIPGLGYLFRSRTSVDNDAELLIFVTPRILREGARIN